MMITFLTKLRISEIQINDEDKSLEELIKEITQAMRRRKIICFLATIILIVFMVNDIVE